MQRLIGDLQVYTLVVELPVLLLYRSSRWSAIFLLFIFSVSVWNGGGFYIEVFGRKFVSFSRFSFSSLPNNTFRFERELEALRKELAESAASRSGATTPFDRDHAEGNANMGLHSRNISEITLSESNTSESPILVPKDIGLSTTPVSGSAGIPPSVEQSVTAEPKKDR